MLYIQKMKPTVAVKKEITKARAQIATAGINEQNVREVYRSAFDEMDKTQIRKQLLKEQHYLCGYCMRRIDDSGRTTIEHLKPLSKDIENAFAYSNYMAVCDGGRGKGSKKNLCCDAAKGNTTLYIDPYNKEMMGKIKYERNGRIYVDEQNEEDKRMNQDINYVLKLNGSIDDEGKWLYDSDSELVKNRKDEYRKYKLLIEGLKNRKLLTYGRIQSEINKLLDKVEYDEYLGVKLFFLKRKMGVLKGKH